MTRRELVASTTTPDGVRLTLSLRAGDYDIEVDGQGLMSTRAPNPSTFPRQDHVALRRAHDSGMLLAGRWDAAPGTTEAVLRDGA